MKPEPLVSVIMPLYNAEKYVGEAIQSIIHQTHTNWELLIVNDGSNDKSHELAKTFGSDKIKVFSQENKGASAARNHGLREAKGEYIQFLDADDLLGETKIEDQVKLLIENPEKVAVCPTIHFFDGENYSEKPIEHHWYQENFDDPVEFLITLYGGYSIRGGMIQPNTWLTPKSVIDKAGLWNEDLHPNPDDDGEYFCRVLLESKGTMYAPNAINYYRKFKKTKSLSAQKSRKAMESILKSAELKSIYLLARTSKEEARKALARCFMEIAVNSYPEHKKLSKKAEKNLKNLGGSNYIPVIGGDLLEFLKKIFGWKFSKKTQYYWDILVR